MTIRERTVDRRRQSAKCTCCYHVVWPARDNRSCKMPAYCQAWGPGNAIRHRHVGRCERGTAEAGHSRSKISDTTIMTDHIGIVACSAEGAALCYRTICVEGAEFL